MIHACVMPLLLLLGQPPEGVVDVSARLDLDSLEVGTSGAIVVEWSVKEEFSDSKAGMPAPIVQVDVPDSVRLKGKVLTDRKELRQNEFLQAPFERLLDNNPLKISFKIEKVPSDGDRIAINVIGYVAADDQSDSWFIRRRIEMPVAPAATGVAVDPTNSHWGQEDLLRIGDKAAPFELPRADGTKVALGTYLGDQNVIVTTYRAFW